MSGITTARRIATVAVSAVVVGGVLAACSSTNNSTSGGSTPTGGASTSATGGASSAPAASTSAGATGGKIKSGLKVYYIPKDTQNPYEVLADKGGQNALKELGGSVTVTSGTADTAAAQLPSIQSAIQAKADAIVIAANDASALCPSLNKASQAGIKIVAFDSDINCGTTPNHLFINQADTKTIGTSEVDLLASQINSTGEIAILSAAASATNQNSWIKYMKQQLTKYPKMKLVQTVYGDDDPAKSLSVLQGILSGYPNLKGIISPTTVGISTAAQYLSTHPDVQKRVVLTGLGLPSQMRKYIKNGTVKSFELWNPTNLGYLAGYAAASLASGTALQAGSSFESGNLKKTYMMAGTPGALSVVLGPPTVFDKSNIDQFNF